MLAGQFVEVPAGVSTGDQSEPGSRLVRRNRFRTRMLFGAFVLLAAPLAAFLGAYLSLWLMIYLAPGFFYGARGLGVQLFVAFALIALLAGRVIWVSRRLPQVLGAQPLARSDGVIVWRRLDSLASALHIPAPTLYLLPVSNANAFAAGPGPHRASIVITRGLLERMSLRELDGVLAHEMSHVVNEDARLNSMAAAIFRIARIPVFVVWLAALCAAIAALLAPGGPAAIRSLWSAHQAALLSSAMGWSANGGPGPIGWRLELAATGCLAAGLLMALLWPAIAWGLRRTIVAGNEMAVDAQAVRLTRDPLGLACAIAKICGGAAGQFDKETEDGSERPGCRPWPKGGAWRRETPSVDGRGDGGLKRASGIGHACFAPLDGLCPAVEARIGALRAMAPDEAFDVTRELPETGFVAAAASKPVVALLAEDCGVFASFMSGLLFGWIASTFVFDMRLVQLWVDPSYVGALSGDLRSVAAANIFGVAGAVAAFAALYKRRRLSWWPVVVMLLLGQYLPRLALDLVSGPLPMSSFSVLIAYIASLTEVVGGAVLGAVANRRLFFRRRNRQAWA